MGVCGAEGAGAGAGVGSAGGAGAGAGGAGGVGVGVGVGAGVGLDGFVFGGGGADGFARWGELVAPAAGAGLEAGESCDTGAPAATGPAVVPRCRDGWPALGRVGAADSAGAGSAAFRATCCRGACPIQR